MAKVTVKQIKDTKAVSALVTKFMRGEEMTNDEMDILMSALRYMSVEDKYFMYACAKAGYRWTVVEAALNMPSKK